MTRVLWCAVLVVLTLGFVSASSKDVLDALLSGYDILEPPGKESGNATLVNVSMHIAHIYDLSAVKEEVTVGMYLRALWNDPRLAYNDSLSKEKYLNIYSFRYRFNIWRPDLFFVDAKNAEIPRKPMPAQMMRIYKNGNVFVSYRLLGQIYCAMNWNKFPMDTQHCPIRIEVYSYYKRQVEMSWHYNHTFRSTLKTWPINDFWFKDSKQWNGEETYSSGKYQSMTVDLYFARNLSYYLRQIYLPSLILVILAYLPCWMKPEVVFSRTVFLFSLLICMLVLTINSNITHPIPIGVYVTALEVWLASCCAFVTMSLMQTVVMRGLRGDTIKTSKIDTIPLSEAGPDGADPMQYTITLPAPRVFGLTMTPDMVWRITYPTLILLYNIIYWPIYSA